MTDFTTCDLHDANESIVRVVDPGFRSFGGKPRFRGPIRTLSVRDDNALVRKTLSGPGEGHVLVVDGGGSKRVALLGDQLAKLAVANGWAGVVVHGCIRDSVEIGTLALGVRALDTQPRRAAKAGVGDVDTVVHFHGVDFAPGAYLYADEDGILVAPTKLI